MASEPDVSEISSVFERMVRNRDLTLFLPFLFGLSNDHSQHENESIENPQRIILINPFTQGMVVIDGASSLEALFHDMGIGKSGPPPASKESIDALGSVEVEEGDEGECVICLEEYEVGGVVKELPCKHRFHGDCVEKWLGIHGSCPVCRYEMPFDEEVGKKKDGDDDGGERRRRIGRDVWVSFSFNGEGRSDQSNSNSNSNSNQASSDGSNDSSSSPRDDSEAVDS